MLGTLIGPMSSKLNQTPTLFFGGEMRAGKYLIGLYNIERGEVELLRELRKAQGIQPDRGFIFIWTCQFQPYENHLTSKLRNFLNVLLEEKNYYGWVVFPVE